MAVMTAVPAVASAQLTLSGPSLARNSGPSGSVLVGGINSSPITNSTVTVSRPAGSGTALASIHWFYTPDTSVGSEGCVNVTNFPNAATNSASRTVNPALPRDPGAYQLSFEASSVSCTTSGGTRSPRLAVGAVTVTPRTTNPANPFTCGGLRVALVLDESLSIAQAPGGSQTGTVRDAALAFVRALNDTETSVAIIPFSQTARTPTTAQPLNGLNYTSVTDTTIASTFEPFINATGTFAAWGYNPSRAGTGGTNWDAGFAAVPTLSSTPPDLVVFVTDGDPNGTRSTTSFSTTLNGGADVMTAAVGSAATVKQNSRVFAVGVGDAVNSAAGISRLTAVSGDHEFTGTENFADSDYTVAREFEELRASLTGIVRAICGGSLVVTKKVFGPNGEALDASGWRFSATLTPPPQHEWLRPSVTRDDTIDDTTNGDGLAQFGWRLIPPLASDAAATLSVREHRRRGFRRVYSQCRVREPEENGNVRVRQTQQRTRGLIADGLHVPIGWWATCEVWNQQRAANLTVVKRLQPRGDPGRFNLLVNDTPRITNVGHRGTTGRLLLALGTHTVTETGGTEAGGTTTDLGLYDTSTRCVNRTTGRTVARNPEGPEVSVRLRRESDNIVCTITNRSTRIGNLTVIKNLVPTSAPGHFNLLVNGAVRAAGVRHGGTASLVGIPFGTYQVSEEMAAGETVTLADFRVSTVCIDQSTSPATEVGRNDTGPNVSVDLSATHDDIVCTITNEYIQPPPKIAHLQVVKRLVPSDDVGLFDLRVNGVTFAPGVGDRGETASLPLEVGTHTVSERGAEGTDLGDYSISTTCRNGGDVVAHATGPSVRVTLHESDNVVCTITNRLRSLPDVPEGGGVPPPPCPGADCGDLAAAPDLAIAKQMPARARVGSRVTITITVKNVSSHTAHDVRLQETPPLGGRLVRVANGGSIQRDGTAVWHLGSLAPGASRTVRATMVVRRAGSHVNSVVVSAGNADPAVAQASVRARAAARRPPPPPVTG